MKLILQAEAAECGLASIAMVASHYKINHSLYSLREQFPQSLKGLNLQQIIDISSEIGFNSRPLKLDIAELTQLSLPCILHWDLNHFVVLYKVTKQEAIIFDPAKGKVKYSIDELAKHFTGVALELSPNTSFIEKERKPVIAFRDLNITFKGLKTSFVQLFVLSLMLQVFVLAMPYYMQTVIDDVLVSYDSNLLVVLASAFAFVVTFKHLFSLLRGHLIIHLGTSLGRQFTELLFNHLIRLPLSYFEARHVADIVSRFGSIEQIKRMLAHQFVEACIDGIMATLTLIVLYLYEPTLATVSVVVIILYLVLRLVWYSPFKRVSEDVIRSSATEQAHFMETIRGIQSIKLMALEPSRTSQWLNKFVSALNNRVKVEKLQLHFGLINGFLFGIENVVIIYLGASLIIDGSTSPAFTLGMLMAFISYKTQVTSRFSALIDTYVDFKMLSLHFSRISDIALSKKNTELPKSINHTSNIQGPVEISQLAFKYPQANAFLFSNLSLSIKQGESIAIVGKSGLGKSTFMKVVIGLLKHSEGHVLFNGDPLEKVGLRAFRTSTAAVMQNDQLLTGSIAENIANFSSKIDMKRVKESADIASIHQDILAMPMGYDSYIGEMGGALSGGQTQRILLARALYRQPSILFLDEATSNLDVATEQMINQRLSALEITTLFIAHRVETIKQADRVIELTPTLLKDVSRDYF